MKSEDLLSMTELIIWQKYHYEISKFFIDLNNNINNYVESGCYEFSYSVYGKVYSDKNLIRYLVLDLIKDGYRISNIKSVISGDPYSECPMFKFSFNISWCPEVIIINNE